LYFGDPLLAKGFVLTACQSNFGPAEGTRQPGRGAFTHQKLPARLFFLINFFFFSFFHLFFIYCPFQLLFFVFVFYFSGSDFFKEAANQYNQQSIFIKQRKIRNLLF
jgi:hypothetical protein